MKSASNHKFFKRELHNDLEDLYVFLHKVNNLIVNEELFKIDTVKDHTMTRFPKDLFMNKKDSIPSITTDYYNIFQFKHPALINLLKAIKSMTIEACSHYGVQFEDYEFAVHGWFNLYTVENRASEQEIMKKEKRDDLPWHDHGGDGFPSLHGYYSVSAEPSNTYYKVFDKDVTIDNKNNVALLSETGHLHAMAPWRLDKNRITIAYDVVPINKKIDPISTYFDNKVLLL